MTHRDKNARRSCVATTVWVNSWALTTDECDEYIRFKMRVMITKITQKEDEID